MKKYKSLIILGSLVSFASIATVVSCFGQNGNKSTDKNDEQESKDSKQNKETESKNVDFINEFLKNKSISDFTEISKKPEILSELKDVNLNFNNVEIVNYDYVNNKVTAKFTFEDLLSKKTFDFGGEISGFKDINFDNEIQDLEQKDDIKADKNDQRVININSNWKFAKTSDVDSVDVKKTNFDDSQMLSVNLPHDWSIYNDFSPNISNEWGALEGGTAWYRKELEVKPEWKDKEIEIHFGGVYMESEVYVNGQYISTYPAGYQEFNYNIGKYLDYSKGAKNVVTVKVTNKSASSRWYSGSGIYRDVVLKVTDKLHLNTYGTQIINNDFDVNNLSNVTSKAIYTISNDDSKTRTFSIKKTVYKFGDDKTELFSNITENIDINPNTSLSVETEFNVNNVELWDVKNPNLYVLKTELIENVGGKEVVVDQETQRYGYRKIDWTSNDGFSLNGKWLKFHGVSMHHDQGALGAVANYDAIYRQMRIMKEMGVNAIRSTHNPADQKLVQIAEELGLLFIDEAFDTWYGGKKTNDYHRFFEQQALHPDAKQGETWAEFDVKQMVRSKINSPAIIMWSIGNEIAEGTQSKGVTVASNLVKWIKEVDKTRYVTWGSDRYRYGNGQDANIAAASNKLDVVGMNYSEANAPTLHNIHPNWKIYGSETSSAVRSRGVWYAPNSYDNETHSNGYYGKQQSDYGNNRVGWGKTATESWKFDRDNKWYAGQFIWTGFDYIGEPTPWWGQTGNDKPKSSYFGIVDTAGFPKNDYYLYQSQWLDVKEHPMVKIAPHLNFDKEQMRGLVINQDGTLDLRVYSNAKKVVLKADGKEIATKEFQTLQTNYTDEKGNPVSYQQGANANELYLKFPIKYDEFKNKVITAEAYDSENNLVATDTIQKASTPVRIQLKPEKNIILANGDSLSYVQVTIVDENGIEDPNANNLINFTIEGQGEIVGVDNGNALSRERYKAYADGTWKRQLFNGKALVIVKSTNKAGEITLSANSENLESGETNILTVETLPNSDNIIPLALDKSKLTVNLFEQPDLSQVNIILSNGQKVNENITWDTTSFDNNNTGQYVVKATYKNVQFDLKVEVIDLSTLYRPTKTYLSYIKGEKLALPDTVLVLNNQNELEHKDVVWNISNLKVDKLEVGDEIEINGYLADNEQIFVKAYLNVLPTTTNEVNTVKSNNNTVEMVYVGTKLLENFDNDTKEYSGESEYKNGYPLINFIPTDKNTKTEQLFIDIDEFNREYIAIITAQDGSQNIIKYKHHLTLSEYNDAHLNIQPIVEGRGRYAKIELKLHDGSIVPQEELSNIQIKAVDPEDNKYFSSKTNEVYASLAKNSILVYAEFVYKGQKVKTQTTNLMILKSSQSTNVESYSTYNLNVLRGEEINLPNYVEKVYQSDKFPRREIVEWENIPNSNSLGIYQVKGTLLDSKETVYATVSVYDYVKVEPITVKTIKGFEPYQVPDIVLVSDNLGNKITKTVTWDKFTTSNLNSNEDYIVEGTIDGVKNIKAQLNVSVVPEKEGEFLNISKQVTGFDYPAAIASFTNDLDPSSSDRIDKINDGVVDARNKSANKWSNWQRNSTRTSDWVGTIFARGGIIGPEMFDQLKVWFGEDGGTKAPTNFKIQVFEQPITNLPNAAGLAHISESDSNLADDSLWKDVELKETPTIVANNASGTTFNFAKPVKGYALRIKMDIVKGKQGILIYEFQVNRKVPQDNKKGVITTKMISSSVQNQKTPVAIAGFTNDGPGSNDRVQYLNDNIIETDVRGINKWSNWQNQRRAEDWVGVALSEQNSTSVDSLRVFFGVDGGSGLPKEYHIEYFDQPITNLPSGNQVGHINDHRDSNLSDDKLWKEVTLKNKPEPNALPSNDTQGALFEFATPVKATAIRIRMKTPDNKNGIVVREIRAFSTSALVSEAKLLDVKIEGKYVEGISRELNDYYIDDNVNLNEIKIQVSDKAKVTKQINNYSVQFTITSEDLSETNTYRFTKRSLLVRNELIKKYEQLIQTLESRITSNLDITKYSMAKSLVAKFKYLSKLMNTPLEDLKQIILDLDKNTQK
ncbi:glycoside hydrolase family 2 TIM barrel-domain containing protein [Mycoplasma sp. OR1901]|uniref:glycoside hydrolase family 2 TIM barrel-domain containing protein n=1 Tax=Mycoplasma sp. OR1901 TaxID=2742195 RepID=UPI001583EF5F|nr:glycoside hydrolase family 2 TIM barrel-domain containing protein [Mycoplasma sp. OR1901]QKT05380.1 hypothetical protein HTZ87_01540 [Mycoplasma sp. OR1901]